MIRRNNNIVFGGFVGVFIVTFVLLYNSLESSSKFNSDSSSVYLGEIKYGFLEKRQNLNTTNFVQMPKYQGGSSNRFRKNLMVSNGSINSGKDEQIISNYEVSIDRKNDISFNKNNGSASNYISNFHVENYSSKKIENNSNINDNSQLVQSINQLASLNGNKTSISIQGSSNIVKSDHGFMAVNTDVSAIESSMNINENGIQKTSNDINPGEGGEMGNPIPVGDGWILLLMLALGYGGLKGLKN